VKKGKDLLNKYHYIFHKDIATNLLEYEKNKMI